MAGPGSESVPVAMRPTFNAIVALTDRFCRERWTEEYAELCRKLAAALCRKRPSPLQGSRSLNTWAAGIVHAIALFNFLFDRSNPRYLSASDLAAAFGLSVNTVSARSKAARDYLGLGSYDWHWAVPSQQADYPGAWSIMVDGWVVDARSVPREVQEEAYRKGFIPFVWADRNKK